MSENKIIPLSCKTGQHFYKTSPYNNQKCMYCNKVKFNLEPFKKAGEVLLNIFFKGLENYVNK